MHHTVTRLHIASTSGANQRPRDGDAVFADGASYAWLINTHADADEVLFYGVRRREGHATLFAFRSPTRAAALLAKLEG